MSLQAYKACLLSGDGSYEFMSVACESEDEVRRVGKEQRGAVHVLVWRDQFLTDFDRELAFSAEGCAVYRVIDCRGIVLTQDVVALPLRKAQPATVRVRRNRPS